MNAKILLSSFLSLFFITSFAFASFDREDTPATDPSLKKLGWEAIYKSDGILVHKKEIQGSPLVAFRGEAEIDAPIAKVANVLYDTSRKSEWVANAIESKNVIVRSAMDRVEYNKTQAPWPLKNRDFLFEAKVKVDKSNKQILIGFHSVEDKTVPPSKDCVRGWLGNSKYILTAIDEKRTNLIVEIQADPRGSVPKWIVNMFQRKWPVVTIENIRKQANKPDVGELAGVTDLFFSRTSSSVSGIQKAKGGKL